MKLILRSKFGTGENSLQFDSANDILLIDDATTIRAESVLRDAPKSSLHHARLNYEMGIWWIEDTGSETGIFYNGTRINSRVPISPDTPVRLGDKEIRFLYDSTEDSVRAAAGDIESVSPASMDERPQAVAPSESLDIWANIRKIVTTYQGSERLRHFVYALRHFFPQSETRATILLYHDKQLLPVAYTSGQAPHSFTLAERAIIKREAFAWYVNAQRFAGIAITAGVDAISAIYAPIIHDYKVYGVLHIDTVSDESIFEKEDVHRLEEIAFQFGAVISEDALAERVRIPSIFVSYSHRDTAFVTNLAKGLRRKRVDVWYDNRLHAGSDWRLQLKTAIETFDAFVLVYSPESVASPYVRDEINLALNSNKRIIPVMYRKCEPLSDLRHIQYLSINSDSERDVDELVTLLYDAYGT